MLNHGMLIVVWLFAVCMGVAVAAEIFGWGTARTLVVFVAAELVATVAIHLQIRSRERRFRT